MFMSFPLTPSGLYSRGVPKLVVSGAVEVPHTGDTSETTLKTVTIPANSMGPNGYTEVLLTGQHTPNANNKTYRVRFGGTLVGTAIPTTSASGVWRFIISNVNATNVQKSSPLAGVDGVSGNAVGSAAIDTTADVTLLITGLLANGADSIAVADLKVWTVYAP